MSSLNRVQRTQSTGRFHNMVVNHYGTKVPEASNERKLVRTVLANMLWEDQFYVDGKTSAQLVQSLVGSVKPAFVSELAKAARSKFKLRHVPLLLARELARNKSLKAETLTEVVQRPDEMAEFLAMYWKEGKTPIANQVKIGLANAFKKFNAYQLAKWDKNSSAIKLRDVMFMVHPKPDNKDQELLFKKLAANELETPDTWEAQLSAGADKKETFSRLMSEKKLGALAFLRNLRNMAQAGVDEWLIKSYASSLDVSRVLPFRYIAAARVVPQFTAMLEEMMFRSIKDMPKLKGKTTLLVDVSGSMFGTSISAKSDLERYDAAAALAILCREICEEVEIYSFSNSVAKIKAHIRGFALVEAIRTSQIIGGTELYSALCNIAPRGDRVIVFTDEQASGITSLPDGTKGYIVNIAAYEHGLNHADWLTISGFSEAVLDYIQAIENEDTLMSAFSNRS